MSDVLVRDTLLSLTDSDNPPVGVNFTRPAFQVVYVNGPAHEWTARKVGKNTYHLSVDGYPYVGVEGGKVIASIYPKVNKEWVLTWGERQQGFLIELADNRSLGWKVGVNGEVEVGVLIMNPIYPPLYPTNQLFRWKDLVGISSESK